MNPVARLVYAALFALPNVCGAQQLALQAIDSLAAAGQVGAARTALDEWWRADAVAASRAELQRAIWLRGKLSLDAERAERDYQRLVLEYPGGPYTDGALLRLGLAARERGDAAKAASYFETLLRDYPASPYRHEATQWLESVRVRGAGGPEPRAERRAMPAATSEARPPVAGPYTVQLGAFSTVERARSLAAAARAAGLDPRVVRVASSRLVRVRVGRFTTPDAATAARSTAVAKGFQATVVSDAAAEEGVP
ncbi:MAG: SPOR domain-containing protein [Gemmatimonadetes bacterium]|nr:SPOR domain-containing protein [Gemmatimonadota bacterium]